MRNYKMLQLREEKGWSQQRLADEVDVTRQTINGIEKGNVNPSFELMCKICRALGTNSFDDVFSIPPVDDEEK